MDELVDPVERAERLLLLEELLASLVAAGGRLEGALPDGRRWAAWLAGDQVRLQQL